MAGGGILVPTQTHNSWLRTTFVAFNGPSKMENNVFREMSIYTGRSYWKKKKDEGEKYNEKNW